MFSNLECMCLKCINLFGHFLTNEKNRHEINAPGNDYRNLSVNSKITDRNLAPTKTESLE